MQSEGSIHNISMLDKHILVLANKLVSEHGNSVVKNLGYQFIGASEEVNRAILLNFFGLIQL